jgi:3,4-dihydroxy 2-butanone 4-phosphate synthase / GTP cyclohydrolase II
MTVEHTIAGTLLLARTRRVATRHGDFVVNVCDDLTRHTYALLITRGDVTTPAPLVARVHSSCVTSETYGGCDCDCAEQLDAALSAIAAAGRGVVFYLDQEGRGAGFAAKVRDRMLVQASRGALDTFGAYAQMGLPDDLRSYEAVAAGRALLGITAPLALLTNNPAKLATLRTLGVPLADAVALTSPPSPYNRQYLEAKAKRGHHLTPAAGREAEPPEAEDPVAPHALAIGAGVVRIGAYWLPIRRSRADGGDAHWFRLHAYVDLATGRERVVLTHGDPTASPTLLRIEREVLLERLVASGSPRWSATVRAFVTHGSGVAVMMPHERSGAMRTDRDAAPIVEPDATTLALARHHLAGRTGIPLLDGPRDMAPSDAGLALAAPRLLPVD